MQPEEFSDDEFIRVNKIYGFYEKDKDVLEEMTLAKKHFTEGILYFMTKKVQRIKCQKLIQT